MPETGPAGDHVSLLPNDGLTWDDLRGDDGPLRALAAEVALARHAVPALVSGPPGAGKTLAARVLTAALRLDLVEVRVRGFAAEADRLVPLILDEAEARHVSLLFDDAELLRGPALEAALARAATMRGMLFFETRHPEAVDPSLRASARPIELGADG